MKVYLLIDTNIYYCYNAFMEMKGDTHVNMCNNNMKKILVVISSLLILLFTGCGNLKADGMEIAEKFVNNFDEDKPFYVEFSEGDFKTTALKLSETEQLYTSTDGTVVVEYMRNGDEFSYAIDDVVYTHDSDSEEFFEFFQISKEELIVSMEQGAVFIKSDFTEFNDLLIESFDEEIESEVEKDGDLYIVTGVNDEGNDYKIKLNKNGESIDIVEGELAMLLTFDESEFPEIVVSN